MDFIENALLAFLALLGVICLGILVWCGVMIYQDSQSPTFELQKDKWACSASHTETTVVYQKVGDVQVPQHIDSVICDQWTRK